MSKWYTGDVFLYNNQIHSVKDTDTEVFYNTNFKRTWLKFYDARNKCMRWIDSFEVSRPSALDQVG